jgi:hypothetical protein
MKGLWLGSGNKARLLRPGGPPARGEPPPVGRAVRARSGTRAREEHATGAAREAGRSPNGWDDLKQ